MLTASPRSQVSPPPRLKWAVVLALTVITLGVFLVIWAYVQCGWVARVRRQSRARLFLIYYTISAALSVALQVGLRLSSHGHSAFAVLSLLLLQLTAGVFWFTAVFTLRGEMESSPISLDLDGILTFLLGPIYFQYKLDAFEGVTEEAEEEASAEADYHELIYLMDEMDDERARARFRESIYIAVIIWLAFFALLRYVPRYVRGPQLVSTNPHDQKQNTLIELPPDQLKKIIKPHPTPNIAERNQRAQSPQPTPQTAPMPAPGHPAQPAPKPVPQQPQQQAAPKANPAPQQAPPQPQQQIQHPQPQQAPLADSPTPAPTKPNFSMNRSAGEQIQQAARGARGGSMSSGGGGDGPSIVRGGDMGTKILSDTQGLDFSKWILRSKINIERTWAPLIPEECNAPLFKKGIVGIRVRVNPDGSIAGMWLDYSTHDVAINKSAWGSITSMGVFPELPKGYKGPLEVRWEFRMNQDAPGVQ